MKKFISVYYATDSERIPVKKFIDSLNTRTQQKFFAVVEMLEKYGKSLPEPHAKYLGEEIYELRFKGQEGHIRVLHFFYHENKVVLTNGFIKKSNKTPKKEIDLAISRRETYINKKAKE